MKSKQLTNFRVDRQGRRHPPDPAEEDDAGTGDCLHRRRRNGRSHAQVDPPAQAPPRSARAQARVARQGRRLKSSLTRLVPALTARSFQLVVEWLRDGRRAVMCSAAFLKSECFQSAPRGGGRIPGQDGRASPHRRGFVMRPCRDDGHPAACFEFDLNNFLRAGASSAFRSPLLFGVRPPRRRRSRQLVLDDPAAVGSTSHPAAVQPLARGNISPCRCAPRRSAAQRPAALGAGRLAWRRPALDAEAECLATAVYFESMGEPLEGQLAVAQVVINRAKSGRYPPHWCGVVKQKAQFSFVRRAAFRASTPPARHGARRRPSRASPPPTWSSCCPPTCCGIMPIMSPRPGAGA